MGTDIHSIAQVNRDGQWQTVAVGIDGDQRSYNTFAMLANVRNGYGFAGCRTSTGFPVIHEQRGLPEDLEADENAGLRVNKSDLVCAWDWDGNVARGPGGSDSTTIPGPEIIPHQLVYG